MNIELPPLPLPRPKRVPDKVIKSSRASAKALILVYFLCVVGSYFLYTHHFTPLWTVLGSSVVFGMLVEQQVSRLSRIRTFLREEEAEHAMIDMFEEVIRQKVYGRDGDLSELNDMVRHNDAGPKE